MSEPMSGPVRLAATLDGPRDAPVLVLGNSLGTIRDLWEPQLTTLGERFRLLRYEHRGHGGSPAPPGPYTLADLGADVLRLLDDFGVEHASYCGVSLGGMIGMWLAANAPGRIDALGLCCTSARFPDTDLWVRRAAAVRDGGLPPISARVVSRWFTPAFAARHPSVPAAFAATLDGVDPEGYAGCCDAIAAMDLRPALAGITAPTLVISGSEDPATPPWHGAVMARGITRSRLAVIRGASHLASVSNPGEVTAALSAHLLAMALTGLDSPPGRP
ncbi:MAG TPA: 3-oxoadipate enol-lactonase [Streptosporangiaceae bacterium]|nr:3-oxoadipate enol-lactonase [Streptosporangiaceae bacterium]